MDSQPRTNRHVYGERSFWVKGEEALLARAKILTVVIRPDDRSDQILAPKQWLPLFTPVPVYFISRPGDQARGISAEFHPDCGMTVEIVRRVVTRIGDVKESDLCFRAGRSVPTTLPDILRYLGAELAPGREFTDKSVITLYSINYLPNEAPATN